MHKLFRGPHPHALSAQNVEAVLIRRHPSCSYPHTRMHAWAHRDLLAHMSSLRSLPALEYLEVTRPLGRYLDYLNLEEWLEEDMALAEELLPLLPPGVREVRPRGRGRKRAVWGGWAGAGGRDGVEGWAG